jgi:protein-S-isoprenylcysteine O-methyltransferase Ste14
MNSNKLPTGKEIIGQIFAGLTIHAIVTAVLALLGLFVWNVGFAPLTGSAELTYMSSWAIMTGIYVVGLVFNFFYTKWLNVKLQKEVMTKIFGKK